MSKDTQWVLVECVSMFRTRYMVEVPMGKDEYALDTVTMNEAKEFSQKYLGENIVSHRIVSRTEALALCDINNEYATEWKDKKKVETFFTTVEDQKPRI